MSIAPYLKINIVRKQPLLHRHDTHSSFFFGLPLQLQLLSKQTLLRNVERSVCTSALRQLHRQQQPTNPANRVEVCSASNEWESVLLQHL